MQGIKNAASNHASGEHVQSRRLWCTIPPETVHNISGIVAALVRHPRRTD